MFYTIKVKLEFLVPLFCVLIASLSLLFFGEKKSLEASTLKQNGCLIIDPGHGGIDGGAVSISGDKESDINLSIGNKLAMIATLYGEKVIMTRNSDLPRTDALSYSEHEDLAHRVEIINSFADGTLISIHQNCFPTSQASGAQVLFADDELSRSFGVITHNNIVNMSKCLSFVLS